MTFYSFLFVLLLCGSCWLMLPVDAKTRLRRKSQTRHYNDTQLYDHHVQEKTERSATKLDAQQQQQNVTQLRQLQRHQYEGSLALVANMSIHFNPRNARRKRATAKCVHKRRKTILSLLNNGFQEVVGRFPYILGTMKINNHACGSERRLAINNDDKDWLYNDDGDDDDDDSDPSLPEGPEDIIIARDLQFRNFDYDYLFRAGATCRLCYPDDSDVGAEPFPGKPIVEEDKFVVLQRRLQWLTIELNAHLTSVLQLSGIRCIAKRSPQVNVTLEATSLDEAAAAGCE